MQLGLPMMTNPFYQDLPYRHSHCINKRTSKNSFLVMSANCDRLFAEVLRLPPLERAQLLDVIFESFDTEHRQKSVDAAWASEAEDRLTAFDSGELSSKPADEVFDAIDRNI
jgi:putative addiction module component (TIGR02574 family)